VKQQLRPICPRLGHLVRARRGSPLHRDAKNNFAAWQNCGLVVDTRGIEVQVLLPGEVLSWVRRDNVEVISETR
jgi:hypothetical protein